jgi:hypothetical protein
MELMNTICSPVSLIAKKIRTRQTSSISRFNLKKKKKKEKKRGA